VSFALLHRIKAVFPSTGTYGTQHTAGTRGIGRGFK
jgi:hypothetical protein